MLALALAWPTETKKKRKSLEEEQLAGMSGPCWCLLGVLVSKRPGSSGGVSCPMLPLCTCMKRSCFRIPPGEFLSGSLQKELQKNCVG